MARFTAFDGETFYGVKATALVVPGLQAEIRQGIKLGQPYSYINFRDKQGVKWKIAPTSFGKHGKAKGMPGNLALFHRNRYGARRMHAQGKQAWGTRGGLQDLVAY